MNRFYEENKLEVGLDEAGRGCLAGPVVAAAVILPKDFTHPLLNDSKQVNDKKLKKNKMMNLSQRIPLHLKKIHSIQTMKIKKKIV